MGRMVQYRCPRCNRLLYKHDTDSNQCEYKAPGLEYKLMKGEMLVQCTKPGCQTISKVACGRLVGIG